MNAMNKPAYRMMEQKDAELKGMELKPCPFCGARAFVWHTNHRTYIECENFNAAGDSIHMARVSCRDAADAAKAWNERSRDAKAEENAD